MRRYPERPVVAVGVVVLREVSGFIEVLMIRRGKAPRQGEWSLPGGRQETGERLVEAAAREVWEECQVRIKDIRLLDALDSITYDTDGQVEYHYSLVDFSACLAEGEASAAGDAVEVCWFGREALEPLGLWDETLRVIDMAIERYRDGL